MYMGHFAIALGARRRLQRLPMAWLLAASIEPDLHDVLGNLVPALGVGPEMKILRLMGPGVVWVAALLASMLSLGRLFSADYSDGSLEQLVLAPQPLAVLVLGKIVAHWLVSGVPLVLMAPLLGVQYGLSAQALVILVASLLLGTPVLSLIGAVGAALTLGLRGGGVLVSLLVLP